MSELSDFVVIDIETIGGDAWEGQMLCISAVTPDGTAGVWPTIPDNLLSLLSDPKVAVVSHTKYDPRWLKLIGVDICGPFHDTKRMAHILNENTALDLDFLVGKYTGIKMDKRLDRKDKKIWFTTDDGRRLLLEEAWEEVPEQVMHYCRRDTEATFNLYLTLREKLDKGLWLSYWESEEVPYTEVLLNMECAGLPIDLPQAANLKAQLEVEASEKERSLADNLGYEINFGSPDQLRAVLFSDVWLQEDRLPITKEQRDCLRERCAHEDTSDCFQFSESGLEVRSVGTKYAHVSRFRKGFGLSLTPPTEKTKKPSTRTNDLIVHHGTHPFVQELLAYRKIDKVIGTYLNSYPRFSYNGRLYGKFDSAGTVTGRLSSSQPNLENQPSRGRLGTEIRSLFKGRLIVGDHSQLEPRLMAHFSGDPVLLDVYRGGKDIYLTIAEYIFGERVEKDDDRRDMCKTLMLALGYGAGAPNLAQILFVNGYPTPVDRAAEYLDHLEDLFSGFFRWKRHIHFEAKDRGYVKTIGGRFRRLKYSYGDAAWKVRNKADRQAVNSIIQGSAADIIRRNMLDVQQYNHVCWLLNQVHDELVWEYDPVVVGEYGYTTIESKLQETCENPGYRLDVPMKFEPNFCHTWADKGVGIELPEEDADED